MNGGYAGICTTTFQTNISDQNDTSAPVNSQLADGTTLCASTDQLGGAVTSVYSCVLDRTAQRVTPLGQLRSASALSCKGSPSSLMPLQHVGGICCAEEWRKSGDLWRP